ncbi:efflux RND transporter periplasmic adaptor subunit [Sphingomonas psychrotolerans]|uniref:Efflux transporter periplasmic adaptor subunit n=1 Tax=Sphingomonas psychrotolerans TaxID=1327635 RepID=A0A2K8MA94_9SPHN|nr:efflux RND transporter periplasmic adaptor subunit [Sphingomonas psychrotolerans]ATY30802.1 efflux transporter periplasmic adaptor subunit [Sphingomonas psychrotolerans]
MNMITRIDPVEPAAAEAGPLDRRRRPLWQKGALVALPVLLVAGGVGFFNRESPAIAAPPPPTVTVAQPLVRQVNEWDDYVGRFEASRSVEVRPRVSGQITGIHFTDGAIVQKGQLLFTLDARPFAAALAEARAGLASAQSEQALAESDLGRAERLVAVEAVSKSDVERLQARVRAARASVAAAQARVRARSLDVEFTQVRAPIAGRISDRKVDAGNLVAAGEGAGGSLLTTINALDPIYFSFDGSEALFLKAKRAAAAGGAASPVEIRLQDEPDHRWKGHLDFTDNGLDPRSGTMRGRAVLSNPGMFLTPGMFGNMRLSAGGTTTALMVPDSAIGTDQARKIVVTVGKDGTLQPKPVVLGPVVDGLRVVRSGLTPQDRVVLAGGLMAPPGSKVQIKPGKIEPQAVAAAPAISAPVTGEATFAR